MPFTTLIAAADLFPHLNSGDWAIIDCRFSLDNTARGERDYLEAHIPGAVYAHLDRDLSGKKIPGKTGRHPLPEIPSFVEILSAWGIDSATQVVAYDDSGGSTAARLWWMLKWLGHKAAAVLDGGWASWQKKGLPARSGSERRTVKRFVPQENQGSHVTAGQVLETLGDLRCLLLDARSAPRYRGEVEPIDPVAGHIPGAVSAPYEQNLTPEGRFLEPEVLRRRFEQLLKSVPVENVICYCGSGVTAAHNLLALAHAGLGMGRLYAGSWSEWIAGPERPIARGDENRD